MSITATPSAATPTLPAINSSSSSSASAGSSSSSDSTGTLAFTQNFNTFLTLLTTQLKNQDPLSPMDSNTFTQQLVSFSEVEQQINTNTNLQSLIALQTAGETISSLPLVGQQIEYNSATAPLQNGQASFSYSLPTASAQTALVVTDASGNVIYNTAGATSAGQHSFVWNGQNNSGQQMPNDGAYTLQVIANNATAGTVTATVQSIGTVNNVAVTNGVATFDVDGISVPMSELVTVNPSKTSTSAN
ncbi:MAG TPA: flagellar hook capping FlgD N-terminal domain-containing protein [Stellaceae bacterium]|nr:flagellar hook capping FlgD N-terminal domain-containing protein [Stellaceae bacterium]